MKTPFLYVTRPALYRRTNPPSLCCKSSSLTPTYLGHRINLSSIPGHGDSDPPRRAISDPCLCPVQCRTHRAERCLCVPTKAVRRTLPRGCGTASAGSTALCHMTWINDLKIALVCWYWLSLRRCGEGLRLGSVLARLQDLGHEIQVPDAGSRRGEAPDLPYRARPDLGRGGTKCLRQICSTVICSILRVIPFHDVRILYDTGLRLYFSCIIHRVTRPIDYLDTGYLDRLWVTSLLSTARCLW